MATFVISQITARSPLMTENTARAINLPDIWFTIWNPTDNFVDDVASDGFGGSTAPVTFRIPVGNPLKYQLGLSMTAMVIFPQTFVEGSSFTVRAALMGTDGSLAEVLESAEIPMPIQPSPVQPVPIPITVSELGIIPPFAGMLACPVPFRWAGDFHWRITSSIDGLQEIKCLVATRLELCWARGPPPNGPSYVDSIDQKVAIRLKNRYPIGLNRWFFANGLKDFAGLQASSFNTEFPAWYAKRAMEIIWDWGNPHRDNRPMYASIAQPSRYGMGFCGGSFQLGDWFRNRYPHVICFDLAAITQCACALLVDDGGREILDSTWVFQQPNGYIKPGILYGYQGNAGTPWPPGINNPGFLNNIPNNPFVGPPSLTNRNPFTTHAWIEATINFGGSRGVLDATLAVPDGQNMINPEFGLRNRATYAEAHIDKGNPENPVMQAAAGNLNNFTSGVGPPSTGNCYVNNDSAYPHLGIPPGDIARVGVFSVNELMPIPPPPSDLPIAIRAEIETVIGGGMNPDVPVKAFSDASLSNDTMIPLIIGSSSMVYDDSTLILNAGISRLRITFTNAEYNRTFRAKLELSVHVFNDYEHSVNALTSHLMKYQASLSDIISPLATAIGVISLKDRGAIFWVRGNQFIHLSLYGPQEMTDPATMAGLDELARRVDAHLQSRLVQPPNQRRAALRLRDPAPAVVKVGDRIDLVLKDEDTKINAAETWADSSDHCIMLAQRSADDNGVFTFFAVAPGEVEILLAAAHCETMHPSYVRYTVKVLEAGTERYKL
ncbi:MAG: hypothetical protein M1834_000037 [Cirrosporium novae-zelandiae]|nr:MAG: hypothetical protein M1834_000037 [Cirrosporium novae-zelandiae]